MQWNWGLDPRERESQEVLYDTVATVDADLSASHKPRGVAREENDGTRQVFRFTHLCEERTLSMITTQGKLHLPAPSVSGSPMFSTRTDVKIVLNQMLWTPYLKLLVMREDSTRELGQHITRAARR